MESLINLSFNNVVDKLLDGLNHNEAVQQALKEIAERHITEFAGDQHTDFAKVLGLPEVTAADLFKKQGQQDPLIVDAIREQCNFSK